MGTTRSRPRVSDETKGYRFGKDVMVDDIDKQILDILQKDTTISTAEIATRVGLSTTPCWRRIQLLEQAGYLTKRVALVDRAKVNASLDVFVSVRTNRHQIDWIERFRQVVSKMPQVVEVYRMSGDVDYLMRIVVPDMTAYDSFYKDLVSQLELSDVSSGFAMERLKYTTAVPLTYIETEGVARVRRSPKQAVEA